MAKHTPDTLETIKQNNVIQLANSLLNSVIKSTDATTVKKMTPERLKEYRLTLGFLNAVNSSIKTKLVYFRMTDIGAKLAAVKEMTQKKKKVSRR